MPVNHRRHKLQLDISKVNRFHGKLQGFGMNRSHVSRIQKEVPDYCEYALRVNCLKYCRRSRFALAIRQGNVPKLITGSQMLDYLSTKQASNGLVRKRFQETEEII